MSDERIDAARRHARELVTHEVSPVDGARRLGALSCDPADELARFVALARDWDIAEHTCGRDDVERRILEEASMLVADTA